MPELIDSSVVHVFEVNVACDTAALEPGTVRNESRYFVVDRPPAAITSVVERELSHLGSTDVTSFSASADRRVYLE